MSKTIIDPGTFEQLKVLMGVEFIGELMEAFYEDSPELIEQMNRALANGDHDAFRRAAHSLKSNSASFGATHLATLAKELEDMGKSERLEGAETKVEVLTEEYEQVKVALEELGNEP